MVKVRSEVARAADGRVDADVWVTDLVHRHDSLDAETLCRACDFVRELGARGEEYLETGIEMAELVSELRLDTGSTVAALAYRPVRMGVVTLETARAALGEDAAHLLEEVLRMATTSLLEMSNTRLQTSERRDQADNVRRMLIAMIDDARVAVIKLAERVVALRSAKGDSEARQQRIAREAHQVFAPLANRLGIWRLKWELEDLSLRYLAPDIYMAIARQLDGRREERERQVESLARTLEAGLNERGIRAAVSGRAKHIYSIWHKMQAKKVALGEVYDVRAVRVLVPDVAQCYAALGVIHTQWRHVPSEFDDYIASPKENGYRSIHTAVIGPDGRTLEVQIRTHEMHEEAELGVCAHWSYKDGEAEDRPYAEKMNWLRQVVEWREEIDPDAGDEARDLGEELRALFEEERIFVTTPRGHVLDLMAGATPVDFAYRVHTEVGHRCRGALVDGHPVPLHRPLETGEKVEIRTGPETAPRRDWLEAHLGYIRSARAREKIRGWFRARAPRANEREGDARIGDMLRRLRLSEPSEEAWSRAAASLGYDGRRSLCRAVGVGDCQSVDAVEALAEQGGRANQLDLLNGGAGPAPFTPRLELRAEDRQGLLRDVTELLNELDLSLLGNSGRVDHATGEATMSLDVPIRSVREQAILVDRLRHLRGVLDARLGRREYQDRSRTGDDV